MSREESSFIEMSPSSEYFKLLISSVFIPGSILLLGMNQNFFPLASELMSGSESFIPTRTNIACLKANILLQKH